MFFGVAGFGLKALSRLKHLLLGAGASFGFV